MAFMDPVFNPVLKPLINFSPFWGVFILSLLISFIIVLVYKYFTNQAEMKRLKEEQKESQKRMKELKNNPEEMMKIQKEAMSKNLEYMKHSFKATFITILPIILIFGWMNAHLAYEPIYPGERYSLTAFFAEGVSGEAELIIDEGTELLSEARQTINIPDGSPDSSSESSLTWNLKSSEGGHFLSVKVGNDEQEKKVLITKELEYETPFTLFEHSDIKKIQIDYNKLRPLGELSLFGWQPGWLGIYIILSIVFSLGLRKLMKVY